MVEMINKVSQDGIDSIIEHLEAALSSAEETIGALDRRNRAMLKTIKVFEELKEEITDVLSNAQDPYNMVSKTLVRL